MSGFQVIVVDDGSTDETGSIARYLGATVVRPSSNTGSKAGAQTFALQFVETEFVATIDADTTLASDALEVLVNRLAQSDAAAACGYVLPRELKTIWELGRCGEYLFALGFYKRIQNEIGRPLISSGCFSAYRSEAVRAAGGWSDATMTEDVDLTWTFYSQNRAVLFIPEATAFPLEPATFSMLRRQLRRWSHGFIQNLMRHRDVALADRRLRSVLAVMLWDSATASLIYLLITPLVAAFITPWALLIYVVDIPVIVVPIALEARNRALLHKALPATLAFFVLRIVNSVFFVSAVWNEMVVGRRLETYEKGH